MDGARAASAPTAGAAARLSALASQVCAVSPVVELAVEPLDTSAGVGFGALVRGFSIRSALGRGLDIGSREAASLRQAVREHGLLLFRGQSDASDAGTGLSCDELVAFGKCFGRGHLHSAHRVHPKVAHEDVFRVSNNPDEGCFEEGGVGTGGFHSDGFFLPNVYSNAVYQIVRAPTGGRGPTLFADYARAVERLAEEAPAELRRLRRLQAVCDTSGVVHPLVHRHPETGAEVLLLGGIAGILEVFRGGSAQALMAEGAPPETFASREDGRPKTRESWRPLSSFVTLGAADVAPLVAVRRLEKEELRGLMQRLQELLSRQDLHYTHQWQAGDVIVTDNLAVAHKAAKDAGDLSCGLRVLHRVTVAGAHNIE